MRKVISLSLVRFSLGLFFVVLGLLGVLPDFDESIFNLRGASYGIELAFGLAELFCGAYLLAGVFFAIRQRTSFTVTLVVLSIWLVRIFLSRVVWGMSFPATGIAFLPSFPAWMLILSCELVIAATLSVFLKTTEA